MKRNRKLLLFVLWTSLLAGMHISSGQTTTPLTAAELVARIKEHITVPWQDQTVDTFKAGDPEMAVTGIATTFLATLEVLQKAKAAGLNMVITHEPTFYNHFDETNSLAGDPILQAKQDYIRDNDLIVFRYHDHIHQTDPDGIYKGVIDELGWEGNETQQRPYVYSVPPTSLKALVESLQNTYKTANIRVVGDANMPVSQLGLVLGAAGSARQITCLQRSDVEVLIVGETHEWETVEYVRDAVALGKKKALILLGHAISEEGGMRYCADWLRGFISEVPVQFIPATDPFWSP